MRIAVEEFDIHVVFIHSGCGGRVQASTTTFYTPGYNANGYGANLNCEYEIFSARDTDFGLQITRVGVEGGDYAEVR